MDLLILPVLNGLMIVADLMTMTLKVQPETPTPVLPLGGLSGVLVGHWGLHDHFLSV